MKLRQALEKKKFIVTSEVQAPLDDDAGSVVEAMRKVRGRVDGVSVSDTELDGLVGDSIKTCEALTQNRFEAIYQTTTRNKNRIQLQKDLLEAHAAGVDNLLVFTEDYRITGDSLQEIMFFHVDQGKLQSVLAHMAEGRGLEDNPLPEPARFFLGAGVESSWGKNVPDLELKEMEQMTGMGTGYFLTTPVFDVDSFEKYMKRVETFGVPVIAEVMILHTAGMAQFLNRHLKSGMVPDWIINKLARATDKKRASVELFADTVTGLKDLCQGIHIITMGGEDRLPEYLNAAKLR
ncbi:MAG: methylenetetrahydrofolate reductase [Deltaproteobacteria bacterium]|nr:methylenetetrahydrofolate reductase [Deltaproteobacteria bacterium]